MNIEGFITEDGSSSLRLVDLNETYHSGHGAITESEHVYIRMGLQKILETKSDHIRIFEVGFGTGLNVLLTVLEARKKKVKIDFTTVEPFPLNMMVLKKLNYSKLLDEDIFLIIHKGEWNKKISITDTFNLLKIKTSLESFETTNRYDLIYFDAFAPSKQPEIWSLENLEKINNLLDKSGILVTYCAQGQFRRNLQSLGFDIERLPGPPGKFEMIRATKH